MSNGRPATKECHRCHHRFPVTHMQKSTIKVQTGSSGSSVSFNARGKGGRIYSGRKYYRNKTVWTCDECLSAAWTVSPVWRKILLWTTVAVAVIWLFSD